MVEDVDLKKPSVMRPHFDSCSTADSESLRFGSPNPDRRRTTSSLSEQEHSSSFTSGTPEYDSGFSTLGRTLPDSLKSSIPPDFNRPFSPLPEFDDQGNPFELQVESPSRPCSPEAFHPCRLDDVGSAPTTPRVAPLEPTATLREQSNQRAVCLSPPVAPKAASAPPLLVALRARSAAAVGEVLGRWPEAARLPFLDHDVEPPLCAAVRLDCDIQVVRLLLDHGADVRAVDIRGLGPLAVLSAHDMGKPWEPLPLAGEAGDDFGEAFNIISQKMERNRLAIAELLRGAGAEVRPQEQEAAGTWALLGDGMVTQQGSAGPGKTLF